MSYDKLALLTTALIVVVALVRHIFKVHTPIKHACHALLVRYPATFYNPFEETFITRSEYDRLVADLARYKQLAYADRDAKTLSKAKPVMLTNFKSVPTINGQRITFVQNGVTKSISYQDWIESQKPDRVKVCRHHWQLNNKNKWQHVSDESLWINADDLAKEFVYNKKQNAAYIDSKASPDIKTEKSDDINNYSESDEQLPLFAGN